MLGPRRRVTTGFQHSPIATINPVLSTTGMN